MNKVSVIFVQSSIQSEGIHTLTSLKSAEYFNTTFEHYIFEELEKAFAEGSCLCIIKVIPSRLPVDDVLDNHRLVDRLLNSICTVVDSPCEIVMHLLHNGGHMLKLARFAQQFHATVNTVIQLKGSTVIAAVE